METNIDHECWIDCDPSMGGHMMYPTPIVSWTRNGYGPQTMTRREWREYSGGIETRNVRAWNRLRELRLMQEGITAVLTPNPWGLEQTPMRHFCPGCSDFPQ